MVVVVGVVSLTNHQPDDHYHPPPSQRTTQPAHLFVHVRPVRRHRVLRVRNAEVPFRRHVVDEDGRVVFALERARPPMHALRRLVEQHLSRLQAHLLGMAVGKQT